MEETKNYNNHEGEKNLDEVSMEVEREKLKKKKRLKKNIIEFLIGIILLGIAFVYMNNNPAEKTSVVSGLSILYQKVEIFMYSVFGNNGKILKNKYELEKNYNELIESIEKSNCKIKEDISEIINKYNNLQNLSVKEYQERRKEFNEFASEYFKKLKQQCK